MSYKLTRLLASSVLLASTFLGRTVAAVPTLGATPPIAPPPNSVPHLSLGAQNLSADHRSFTIDVEAYGLSTSTAASQIVATLHPRVRTRDVFDANARGLGLGSVLAVASSPTLTPPELQSTRAARRVTFDLAPTSSTCLACTALGARGVYPVNVELRAAEAETVLDHFTTFLVWETSTTTLPMDVALIVPIHLPTALPGAAPADTRSIITIIETLASRPDATLTLLPTAETLDALSPSPADSGEPNNRSGPLVDELRTALDGREVLSSPYVTWDPGLEADDRLGTALQHQRDLGRSVIQERLGVTTVDDIAIVGDHIPSDVALDRLGVRRLVVTEAAIVPGARTIDPSLPFIVDPGATSGRETQARPTVVLDRRVNARLQSHDSDRSGANELLHAEQVTAEIALISLIQDRSTPGGVAVFVPENTSRASFNDLLDGLSSLPTVFRLTTLGSLFALPLQTEQDGTNTFRIPSVRDVSGTTEAFATTRIANSLLNVSAQLRGYQALFSSVNGKVTANAPGTRSKELAALDRRLARLTSVDLNAVDRTTALVGLETDVAQRIGQVGLTSGKRITLTARQQDVPLGLVNSTGEPVDVTMIVESDNIELGDGQRDPLVPARETLRRTVHIDGRVHREAVRVSTRGPGSYSMIIRLRAPNGYEFSRVRYTLRSTAIGPIGTILTVGSLAILALWWGRTILAKRRRTALHRHPAAVGTTNNVSTTKEPFA